MGVEMMVMRLGDQMMMDVRGLGGAAYQDDPAMAMAFLAARAPEARRLCEPALADWGVPLGYEPVEPTYNDELHRANWAVRAEGIGWSHVRDDRALLLVLSTAAQLWPVRDQLTGPMRVTVAGATPAGLLGGEWLVRRAGAGLVVNPLPLDHRCLEIDWRRVDEPVATICEVVHGLTELPSPIWSDSGHCQRNPDDLDAWLIAAIFRALATRARRDGGITTAALDEIDGLDLLVTVRGA